MSSSKTPTSNPFPTTRNPRTWTRDGFLISTDPSLIPIQSLNEAFASDALYWAKPLPEEVMRDMLANSLSFGLYSPTSTLPPRTTMSDASAPQDVSEVVHEIAGHVQPHENDQEHRHGRQSRGQASEDTSTQSQSSDSSQPALIGFARSITDTTTFLYLTDVFILPAWQSQGLGEWLIQCVQSVCDDMPHLRRSMAITGGDDDPHGGRSLVKWYEKLMGMKVLKKGVVLQAPGRGCAF